MGCPLGRGGLRAVAQSRSTPFPGLTLTKRLSQTNSPELLQPRGLLVHGAWLHSVKPSRWISRLGGGGWNRWEEGRRIRGTL